jgi:hypothetical protein
MQEDNVAVCEEEDGGSVVMDQWWSWVAYSLETITPIVTHNT